MNKKLAECLEDLERRIDTEVEDELTEQWKTFADGKCSENVFIPVRRKISRPEAEWPRVFVNDTLDDCDAMLLQQYAICSKTLEEGSGELLSVRCNYGTGIIPSLFGTELFIMPYATDTLPSVRSLPGGIEDIRKALEKGIPELNQNLGRKVFEVGEKFLEIKRKYPKIGKYVNIYAPDTQGPLAICEILWGSDLYLDVHDEPEMVEDMFALATDTFIEYTKKWYDLVPPFSSGYSVDWGMLHKGNVLIRNDAAMNISPDMVREFVIPCDQKIFDEFNGGVTHFCGRGDHYIQLISEMRGIYGINMSEPELNDMDKIYRNTIQKGINIIGLKKEEIERGLAAGVNYVGKVHCGASIAAWITKKRLEEQPGLKG